MRLIDADALIEVLTKEKKQDRSKAYGEHECDLIAGAIGMCIDWAKAIPTAYNVEKVVEEIKEQTVFLEDCTKYGNKNAEQMHHSYSTIMMYEVAEIVDDLIDIVRKGGVE